MIKIENIHTCNWEAAIRSMRNAYDSWALSDSGYGCEEGKVCRFCPHKFSPDWCGYNSDNYILGPKDHKLALTLAKSGTDHGKYLRSIIFSADITAPMYWWKEMDTYKVGTVRNSCSTMHTVMKKPFDMSDFSVDQMNVSAQASMHETINALNDLRRIYINGEYSDEHRKKVWYSLIQLLPSSYMQKATWTGNYAVLRNIYHSRNDHPLSAEWGPFCTMIEKLPYSELITEARGVKEC